MGFTVAALHCNPSMLLAKLDWAVDNIVIEREIRCCAVGFQVASGIFGVIGESEIE